MSRQPGRVSVAEIGFFLSIGIFLLVGFDRQRQVGAEVEKPNVIAEYCMAAVWSGCLDDPADRRGLVTFTRRGRASSPSRWDGFISKIPIMGMMRLI